MAFFTASDSTAISDRFQRRSEAKVARSNPIADLIARSRLISSSKIHRQKPARAMFAQPFSRPFGFHWMLTPANNLLGDGCIALENDDQHASAYPAAPWRCFDHSPASTHRCRKIELSIARWTARRQGARPRIIGQFRKPSRLLQMLANAAAFFWLN